MPIHSELDIHLRRVAGNSGFSVSGNQATLPAGNLDHRRLDELIEVAQALQHKVSLAAGVLTIQPK